jgi:hypothetical protein
MEDIMKQRFTRRKLLQAMGTVVGAGTVTSCGYLIYPERRSQDVSAGAELDPMVILLDGLLVLVGILPGLIAFAVDVSSGCIYMPVDGRVSERGIRRIRSRGRRQRDYELVLREASGLDIKLDDPRLVYLIEDSKLSISQMDSLIIDSSPAIPSARIHFKTAESDDIVGFEVVG